MHRGLLILAVILAIMGLGITAEVIDWKPQDFGPKSRAQTMYLAIALLMGASLSGLAGIYVKGKVQSSPTPIRVYCSYCDTENSSDSTECKVCNLSGYLEFVFE